MARNLNPDTHLQGLLDEEFISFNIKRSEENRRPFPRQVMLLHSSPLRKSVIPGLRKNKERALWDELDQFQNRKAVEKHSFEISSHLFSFLWRFRTDPSFGLRQFRSLAPVDSQAEKKIKVALKKFRAQLRSNLKPGRIYLIPDAEVTFNRQKRFKQGYARRVLIIDVRNDQVVIIPFSTKIERINKNTDILFDSGYEGKSLDPEAFPSVENFPYKIFPRKVALFIYAAQPIAKEEFLEGALVSIGSVRRELLDLTKKRLKNI